LETSLKEKVLKNVEQEFNDEEDKKNKYLFTSYDLNQIIDMSQRAFANLVSFDL
jgi:hypothetical protein